jgi:hypothetical protein
MGETRRRGGGGVTVRVVPKLTEHPGAEDDIESWQGDVASSKEHHFSKTNRCDTIKGHAVRATAQPARLSGLATL